MDMQKLVNGVQLVNGELFVVDDKSVIIFCDLLSDKSKYSTMISTQIKKDGEAYIYNRNKKQLLQLQHI